MKLTWQGEKQVIVELQKVKSEIEEAERRRSFCNGRAIWDARPRFASAVCPSWRRTAGQERSHCGGAKERSFSGKKSPKTTSPRCVQVDRHSRERMLEASQAS